MQIYRTLGEVQAPTQGSAIALGYFDGLHMGHAQVIGRAVAYAGEVLSPCVFTFTMHSTHPAAKSEAGSLLTEKSKWEILDEWGVRLTLCPDFSEFHNMTPEEFVDRILVKTLNARMVSCGEDFRFGSRATGGLSELKKLCLMRDIIVEPVGDVLWDGERISSSRIRKLLEDGNPELASTLLGRVFSYDFTVVHGKELGRKLDSPTINQPFPDGFARPRFGVYASVAYAGGKWRAAVTNIGVRPTVDDGNQVNSETYICGFSGDLYGKNVEVKLLRFMRPEQKFTSVAALRNQIQTDTENAAPIAHEYLLSCRDKE